MNKKIILLAVIIVLTSINLFALGLTTHVPEVLLENLEPGTTYTLFNQTGIKLDINNTGSKPADLGMEIQIPAKGSAKPGFEPLPDASWIKIEKNIFDRVPSGAKIESDVTIVVPNSPLIEGKKYQFYVWTHTMPKPGVVGVGVGLNIRFLITIKNREVSKPNVIPQKPKKKNPKK